MFQGWILAIVERVLIICFSKLPAHKLTRYSGINKVKLVYSVLNCCQLRVFQCGKRLLNKSCSYFYCIALDKLGFLKWFNKEIAKIRFTVRSLYGSQINGGILALGSALSWKIISLISSPFSKHFDVHIIRCLYCIGMNNLPFTMTTKYKTPY